MIKGRGRVAGVTATLTAAVALCAAVARPAPAAAFGSHPGEIRLAHGVALWHDEFRNSAGKPERVVLVHINLAVPGVQLRPGTPDDEIGTRRATVAAMANATHAVAGINADWFDPLQQSAVPRGAVIRNGHVVKSPIAIRQSLYVRSDGAAAIGPIPFAGRVTRPARDVLTPTATYPITSVNSALDADAGGITYITRALAPVDFARSCTVARGDTIAGRHVIRSVRTTPRTSLLRRGVGAWALVAFGGPGATWLATSLRAGDPVRIALTFPDGRPEAAVSGGRTLVQGGESYDDTTGEVLVPGGRNPETFGCVSKSGKSVLLGVVDGRSKRSRGVTYRDLTTYLLHDLRCYSGIVFDGGGSSTLVARLPGHRAATVQNVPSDGFARRIADGLFVYSR